MIATLSLIGQRDLQEENDDDPANSQWLSLRALRLRASFPA